MSLSDKASSPLTWHVMGEGFEELRDAAGLIYAAFGPNGYGMMGSNWFRGWTFEATPNGRATGTMVWAPGTLREFMRDHLRAAAVPAAAKDGPK